MVELTGQQTLAVIHIPLDPHNFRLLLEMETGQSCERLLPLANTLYSLDAATCGSICIWEKNSATY